jgi:Asp-tRNA(Asn)/Glu-tRNA(Gln) amidotransferase A subunit family amidase
LEPCELTALEARRLIGAKRLSPVELLDSCLRRVALVNGAVNAVVAMDEDTARSEARAAEDAVMRGGPLGSLHGLPVGIKDLEETRGLRTTYGSPLFRDNVPTHDLGSVARLREAGAIILGKTNTPEFGAGANTRNAVYGATGNPHDPTRSAAGSSGGSGVALACDMAPLCSGSDTGGSLRNPAAFNGIVGFRPSPGLVASERRGLGWSNLPVLGPMARNVPDVALMLSAMVSDSGSDPLSYTIHGATGRARPGDYHPVPGVDLSTLRVAATPDFGFAPVEHGVRDTFEDRIAALTPLFASVTRDIPDCSGADEAFEVLRAMNFLAAHREKVERTPELVGPNVRANVEEGMRYTLADGARASTFQTAMYLRWQRFFEGGIDLILSPAITISPRPWSELYPADINGQPTRTYFHWLALAYIVTLTGHPAISIPLGRDALGMPFGLQIVGPRGGDALVLAAAAAIEAAVAGDAALARPRPDITPSRRRRPSLPCPASWASTEGTPDATPPRRRSRRRLRPPRDGADAPHRARRETTTADPHGYAVTPNATLRFSIFQGLVDQSADLSIAPGLATRWERESDTAWRFHLRPGVRFHNGADFTAEDVVASYCRVLNNEGEVAQSYSRLVRPLANVEALDPMTVRITTKEPNPLLLSDLASLVIIPRSLVPAGHAELRRGPAMRRHRRLACLDGLQRRQRRDRHRAVPPHLLHAQRPDRADPQRRLLGRPPALGDGAPHPRDGRGAAPRGAAGGRP